MSSISADQGAYAVGQPDEVHINETVFRHALTTSDSGQTMPHLVVQLVYP